MQFSFSTLACPDWSWQDILTHGPAFGYGGVEVRLLERETDLLQRPEFRSSQLAARRRELADAGFRISGLASSVRFDYPDAAERKRQQEIGRAYLELAAELGAEFVRVFGDVLPPAGDSVPEDGGRKSEVGDQNRARVSSPDLRPPSSDLRTPEREAAMANIAEGLQSLGEAAEPLGIDVLMETHGDFSESRLIVETLSRVSSPAVGVLWDTHHPWRFHGEELAESFRQMQPWIRRDTHWKDSVTQSRGREASDAAGAAAAHALMSGHRHADYVLFGGGEFPIAECLRLLLQAGYDGWFCYEWEHAWHPEIEPPEVALPQFPGKLRFFAECCR